MNDSLIKAEANDAEIKKLRRELADERRRVRRANTIIDWILQEVGDPPDNQFWRQGAKTTAETIRKALS